MKVLAFNLMCLHFSILLNYGSAQCLENWQDVSGQCMRCGSSFSGGANTGYVEAGAICTSHGSNLATVINKEQEVFAFGCQIDGIQPWIGYLNSPYQRFIDGTAFVNFSAIDDIDGSNECFYIYEIHFWDEDRACTTAQSFACSRPYISCLDLEMSGAISITYTNTDTSTPATGNRWVRTVAAYSCSDGYSLSGTATRTCTDDGTWDGTEAPQCVAIGVCTELSTPGDSAITYTSNVDSNSKYMVETAAIQLCDDGFKKESGTDSRTCLASGSWTGSLITCEDNGTESITIGLGVGLGVVTLVAAGLLISMLCRPTVPTPPMGPPMGPPRPPMGPPAIRSPYGGRPGFGGFY